MTTEEQTVYSPEELTAASIQLLVAVEKLAVLVDQLVDRVICIEDFLSDGAAVVRDQERRMSAT